MPAPARIADLLDRYDALLLDAYGVLNDAAGPLPGAGALLAELDRRGLPWLVITNDASRLPATVAARLRGFGLPVPAERVLTSGMLIAPHFAARGLSGRRTVVLGPADSLAYVEAAGGVIVAPDAGGAPPEVIVVADDAGFPFLEGIEAAINAALRALDAGVALELVLPNPDLVYPRPGGEVGLTAGAIALVIEATLARVRPGAPRFVPLGKPQPAIYAEARRRLDARRPLAIGDQLDTDVAGARAAGIDVALVTAGVGRWRPGATPEPTWLLGDIAP